MKKIYLLPFLLFQLLFMPFVARAQERVLIDGLNYILNDEYKTASVTFQFFEYGSDEIGRSDFYTGEIVIPETIMHEGVTYSVTSIGDYAFRCSTVTSVTIPNSVTSIGKTAFACNTLSSITIPNSVISIEWGALDVTPWYFNQPDGFVYAGKVLLKYKGNMPEGTNVSIEEGTLGIAGGAFEYCSGLTSVTIPASVVSICDQAFASCMNLSSIVVASSNPYYDSRDNCNAIIETATKRLVTGCKNSVIFDGVTAIGNYAFFGCGMNSVTIPNSVTSIGDAAFGNCSGITSLTIPNSVASVGNEAFIYCGGLTSIIIPGSVKSIGSGAFLGSGLASVTISNGVSSIGWGAFNQCGNLTSVTIPSSVTSIGTNPFNMCNNLTKLIVDDNNSVYDSRGNCNAIIETKSNKLIAACMTTIIPNSIKAIGDGVFSNREDLTSMTIPDGVTSIGHFAFDSCSSLTSLTIPESVTSIGQSAFGYCMGLTSVTIPNGVTSISDETFYACISLTSVTMSNSITTIGTRVFDGCLNLTSITIPNSVTSIEAQAFKECTKLTSINIPSSVTYIGGYCFQQCTALEDVYCYLKNAPSYYGLFDQSNIANATLHVPAGSIEEYKTTDPWMNFKEIVEMPSVSISIGSSGKTTLTSSKALDFRGFEDLKAYVATGYESNGTIWLTRIKDVPAGTPILIKGTAGKEYKVPVMDKCDAYFENMFKGSADEDVIISATSSDGKYKNFYMAGGVFKPASASQKISAGKAYLQVPANFKDAKAGADQTVKIADSGKSSYAPPVDVDLTNVEDLKAYAATGYDAATSTIWLTRIFKIQAGEGVLLKGEAGKEYTLPSAEVQAYYGNMFVGNNDAPITINETSDDGVWTNFYLASGTFKKVSGTREIGTNKSYLQLPTSLLVSSARGKKNADVDEWYMEELETETMLLGGIGGNDDGTTCIDAISIGAQSDVYYNLQGQRVENPRKGVYIRNGKKVIVRNGEPITGAWPQ